MIRLKKRVLTKPVELVEEQLVTDRGIPEWVVPAAVDRLVSLAKVVVWVSWKRQGGQKQGVDGCQKVDRVFGSMLSEPRKIVEKKIVPY